MFISLKQLEGLPVIWQDRQMGFVERGVPDAHARKLDGLIIRKGLGAAKWVPASLIGVLGRRCILLLGKPCPLPQIKQPRLSLAYLTSGQRVGSVTDGILSRSTLRLLALEISPGPIQHMQGKSAYTQDYCVGVDEQQTGHAMITSLRTWAEIERVLGKEDAGWT